MSSDIWNPWHGCRKYSEGCENCYMFYQDKQREKDGSIIYKVKTNFNLPLKKDRHGNFKVKSGEHLRVCMTSDFFLEEADILSASKLKFLSPAKIQQIKISTFKYYL